MFENLRGRGGTYPKIIQNKFAYVIYSILLCTIIKQLTIMINNIVFLTLPEWIALLSNVSVGQFAHLKTSTIVRMNKTGNPYFGLVKKFTEVNILLGGRSYTDGVKVGAGKEGIDASDFKAERCKVGNHISRVVLHNEKTGLHYAQYEIFQEVKPKVSYTFNGNEIDRKMFQDYEVKKSEASRQPQERKVFMPSVTLQNIVSLKMNGTEYRWKTSECEG
jgi:hypothetical protein